MFELLGETADCLAIWVADPERRALFDRQTRPRHAELSRIGALYSVEDADGIRALVMELVEGEDLAQRLVRGPIPLDEALSIASPKRSKLPTN